MKEGQIREQIPLRFLIFGAGAIGTYFGASLAKSNQGVVYLEKPDARSRIMETGMRLNLSGEIFSVPYPNVVEAIPEVLASGPFDFGIFAMKSFDTAAALDALIPYRDDLPPIICLQNGVENEYAIARALGEGRVIPGTVTSAISRKDPHEIVLERLRGVGIAQGHSRVEELVKTFNTSGLNAKIYSSAPAMKWSKMLTNLLSNATSAILWMKPAEVLEHPGLYRLELSQLRETLMVMGAMRIPVIDLPGTPVKILALAVRLPPKISRSLLRRAVSGGRGGKMPSFYIDLQNRRGVTEVDYLNGAVVRYGERVGIPTPANFLLNNTLQRLAKGEIPSDSYANNPDKLLREWQN